MFAKCVQTFISNVYRDSNSLIVNRIIILDVQRKLSIDDWTRKSNLHYSWDYYSIKNRVTKENFTKFESEFREWNIKENNLALFHETLTIDYFIDERRIQGIPCFEFYRDLDIKRTKGSLNVR